MTNNRRLSLTVPKAGSVRSACQPPGALATTLFLGCRGWPSHCVLTWWRGHLSPVSSHEGTSSVMEAPPSGRKHLERPHLHIEDLMYEFREDTTSVHNRGPQEMLAKGINSGVKAEAGKGSNPRMDSGRRVEGRLGPPVAGLTPAPSPASHMSSRRLHAIPQLLMSQSWAPWFPKSLLHIPNTHSW